MHLGLSQLRHVHVACVDDHLLPTITVSPTQTMLATGSYGRVVHINRMADGAPLAILDHEGPSTQLLFAPSDRYLAVVLENKQVRGGRFDGWSHMACAARGPGRFFWRKLKGGVLLAYGGMAGACCQHD